MAHGDGPVNLAENGEIFKSPVPEGAAGRPPQEAAPGPQLSPAPVPQPGRHGVPGSVLTPARDAALPPGASARRPTPPAPIESYSLGHPAVPDALRGFTVLHLSDLHIRRARPFPPTMRRLLDAIHQWPVDLVVLTGDYMSYPGDEPAALQALSTLAAAWQSRLGAYAVFGNHDSASFRRQATSIPGIRWLVNETIDVPGVPLRLMGCDDPADLVATVLHAAQTAPAGVRPAASPPLTIAMLHYPTDVYPAREFGIPIVLSGHTHGGQIRLGKSIAPHTSTDLPGPMAAGVLRLDDTLVCISRGLGQAVVELRVCSPAHAPVYTLTKRDLPPLAGHAGVLHSLEQW